MLIYLPAQILLLQPPAQIVFTNVLRYVFWALFGAIYLCFGMPEVFRLLFEAFGMDPEDESCQPKLRRQLEDVDYVSVEFEGRKLSWQDVSAYRTDFKMEDNT